MSCNSYSTSTNSILTFDIAWLGSIEALKTTDNSYRDKLGMQLATHGARNRSQQDQGPPSDTTLVSINLVARTRNL